MKYRNLSHSLDVLVRRVHYIFGIRNVLYAKWWGISLGASSKFDGKCHFRRFPGSTIIIGNECEFLSRPNSNLIGINRPCMVSTLTSDAYLKIGDNCGFSGTVIGAFLKISIGDNVRFGANTLITDSDWHLDDSRTGKPLPVHIGDNVWLGVNVVVLKGVSIGENSIIGANSLVTRDIPANVVAAGSPCKEVSRIEMFG